MISTGSLVRHESVNFNVERVFPFTFSTGITRTIAECKTLDQTGRTAYFPVEELIPVECVGSSPTSPDTK